MTEPSPRSDFPDAEPPPSAAAGSAAAGGSAGAAEEVRALLGGVRAGERRGLAKAITLVESTRPRDRAAAAELLAELHALASPVHADTVRIGVSGAPGVGKSTFIEAFGLHAVRAGRRVAVLTIDPSSRLAGGSILGDKTRMAALSQHPEAFVRPTPAGRTLGGVARRTREAIVVCEAAGFDVIVVETVGVGQSETAAAGMTDLFMLLIAPLGGDELQGIKRGVMELADLVFVNKADGAQADAARRTVAEYRNALRLMRPRTSAWTPVVEPCSALARTGIAEAWRRAEECRAALRGAGDWAARRAAQAEAWLREEIEAGWYERLREDPRVETRAVRLEQDVRAGRIAPPVAARDLLARIGGRPSPRERREVPTAGGRPNRRTPKARPRS